MEQRAHYAPVKLQAHERTRIHQYAVPDARFRESYADLREDLWDELTAHGGVDLTAFAISRGLTTAAVVRAAQSIAQYNDTVEVTGLSLQRCDL